MDERVEEERIEAFDFYRTVLSQTTLNWIEFTFSLLLALSDSVPQRFLPFGPLLISGQ